MINNELMKGLFNIFIYRIDVESFENFRIRIKIHQDSDLFNELFSVF